ncbi:uncharacterized protein DSM5745_10001 [Aspergillus mulundensis]|uniref:Rhodopsin domain-containing protein n=1 Tax=Aspergillus mulundensis TaxID=1810919 RepID=A0A3D8QML9_9EURO|nr:Uncharacterized protein DSM5745_10001 [Aspergillus mulundensis]RDW62890.1 Uncharacterized protein DSM5745_10001 [Aspergillus mulundensis]
MAITGDNSPNVAGSVIMLTILAFVTFGFRAYCRITRRSWSTEDWIMTAALAPFCVLVAGCVGGAFNGIGIHQSRLALPENQKYQAGGQKFFLIFEVGYCAAIIPIKLSISWMLVRVSEGRKKYVYTQYAVIALFTIMNIVALIFILTNCIPVEAAWDPSVGGSCKPAYVLADAYYACTAVNIVTDWITAIMPIPLLWNVQLDKHSKMAVIGLMGLGIFASLSACVRLKYTVNLTNQDDYLYAIANVVIWGFAENAIGMIVGNVATLRPLFHQFFERTLRRTGYTSSRSRSRFPSNYELSQHGGGKGDPGNAYLSTVTEVHGNQARSRQDSQISDDDSQKMIIHGAASRGHNDIMVSRQVNVTYDA